MLGMKLLRNHPMTDVEADGQLVALQSQSEIEGKNLIVMRNLQHSIDVLEARLNAASIP
jgi:hypothetical protein